MIIIGTFDTQQEAEDIQFISKVVVVENRVHELNGGV